KPPPISSRRGSATSGFMVRANKAAAAEKLLVQPMQPSMRIWRETALDCGQLRPQFLGDDAGAAIADREIGRGAAHRANRCDHRSSAAGEGFAQASRFGIGLPLIDRIFFLANGNALIAC